MENIKVSENDIKQFKDHKKFDHDYSNDIIEAMDLIIYDRAKTIQFGSSVFRNLIYAGDLDNYEQVDKSSEIPFIMKYIVKRITTYPEYGSKYKICDIKCGRRLKFRELSDYIGYVEDGEIINYNSDMFELYNKKHSELKFTDIPKYGDDNILEKWVKLYTELHRVITVRWTVDEIIKGEKIVDDKIFLLKDAVEDSELSKIDLFFFSESRGKFIEVTNLWIAEGKSLKDRLQSIQYNIALNGLQYYLQEPPNLLKYLKRYYSYQRIKKNYKFLKLTTPFLQGNIALLATCYTDINIIRTLIDYGYNIRRKKKYLIPHIENIIGRYSNIYEVNLPPKIYEMTNEILDMNNIDDIINNIDKISDIIKSLINEKTNDFLEKYKIPVLMP